MNFIDLFWISLFLLYYFIFWIENKLSYKKIFFVIFSIFFCSWYALTIFTLPSSAFFLVLMKYSFVIAILFFIYFIISIFHKRSVSLNDLTLFDALVVYFVSRFIIPADNLDWTSMFLMAVLYSVQKFIYIVNLIIQARRFARFIRTKHPIG